jgi:hypothetical protein
LELFFFEALLEAFTREINIEINPNKEPSTKNKGEVPKVLSKYIPKSEPPPRAIAVVQPR